MWSRQGWQVSVAVGAIGFLTLIDVFDRPIGRGASTKLERVAQSRGADVDLVAHKSLNCLTLALHPLARAASSKFAQHFPFEWDATADSPTTHTDSVRGQPQAKTMPLFPYLPVIVWMGMIQVVLGVTHDHDAQSVDEPANLMINRGSIIPFPRPLAVAARG